MSNCGLMTQRLACEIPDKIQGIAVVGATMRRNLVPLCENKKPLKALFIFGSKDTAFIKNGNIVSPLNQDKIRGKHIGIEQTLSYWKKRNSCGKVIIGKKIDKYMTNFGKYKDDGTQVYINDFSSCEQKLRFYDVHGGGHRWPNPKANNGFVVKKAMNVGWASHEIDTANEIVWYFGLIKVH
jgi:polyhydroxybutyrate depolymerase